MEKGKLGFKGWILLYHELIHAKMIDFVHRTQKPYIVMGDSDSLKNIKGGEEQWKYHMSVTFCGYKIYLTKYSNFTKGVTDVDDRRKMKPYQIRLCVIAPKVIFLGVCIVIGYFLYGFIPADSIFRCIFISMVLVGMLLHNSIQYKKGSDIYIFINPDYFICSACRESVDNEKDNK